MDFRACILAFQSGNSVHPRSCISRAGNRYLRRAHYMPALVAVRHDPCLRAFYQALLARHKAKLQAIVAVARKMLHAIFGMFRWSTTSPPPRDQRSRFLGLTETASKIAGGQEEFGLGMAGVKVWIGGKQFFEGTGSCPSGKLQRILANAEIFQPAKKYMAGFVLYLRVHFALRCKMVGVCPEALSSQPKPTPKPKTFYHRGHRGHGEKQNRRRPSSLLTPPSLL
jgi:transposase IS116/IS110/IS902 family protein